MFGLRVMSVLRVNFVAGGQRESRLCFDEEAVVSINLSKPRVNSRLFPEGNAQTFPLRCPMG